MNPIGKGAVHLIHGNQRLLVEEELKKLLARMSDRVDLEFNLDTEGPR